MATSGRSIGVKLADVAHRLTVGGLMLFTIVGTGAVGYGVYSLYVLRPAAFAAREAATAAEHGDTSRSQVAGEMETRS